MDCELPHLPPYRRFEEHCRRAGITEDDAFTKLHGWVAKWVQENSVAARACVPSENSESGSTDKLAAKLERNLKLFIRGKTTKLPSNLKTPLLAFCKTTLGFEIAESEFDGRPHTDYLSQFVEANSTRGGLMSALCGSEYRLFRPGVEQAKLNTIVDGKLGTNHLTIFQDGSGDRYAFVFKNPDHDQVWAGHALARDRFVYLIGFDQKDQGDDVILFVLTPRKCEHKHGAHNSDSAVLVGGVFMRVQNTAGKDNSEHDMVVGRIVAAARSGPHFQEYKREALKWLGDMQDSTGASPDKVALNRVGFVADLMITRHRKGD